MVTNNTISELAERFELSEEFLSGLRDRIVDKENFVKAVRMFNDGELPYSVATGSGTINVAELRHELAVKKMAFRQNEQVELKKALERHKAILTYYANCQILQKRFKSGVIHRAYIKDGHLVALYNQAGITGGFYCAKNEVMVFHWEQVKQFLFNIRTQDKAFFRAIKKAAFADERAIFDFSARTIVKQSQNGTNQEDNPS